MATETLTGHRNAHSRPLYVIVTVVALFNAISKARATTQAEAEGATTKKIKTSSGTSCPPLSQRGYSSGELDQL